MTRNDYVEWLPRFEGDIPFSSSDPEWDLYVAGFVPATAMDEFDGKVWGLQNGEVVVRDVREASRHE